MCPEFFPLFCAHIPFVSFCRRARLIFYDDTSAGTIDLHVQRQLKILTELHAKTPIVLENASLIDTRLTVDEDEDNEPPPPPDDETIEMGKSSADVEAYLVAAFAKADSDGSGSLDAEEVTEMLVNSELKFSEDDAAVVIAAGDQDGDGELAYKEFIPIAIDLVQAKQAMAYAREVNLRTVRNEKQRALERVQKQPKIPAVVRTFCFVLLRVTKACHKRFLH
jgi:hypothetical protein